MWNVLQWLADPIGGAFRADGLEDAGLHVVQVDGRINRRT